MKTVPNQQVTQVVKGEAKDSEVDFYADLDPSPLKPPAGKEVRMDRFISDASDFEPLTRVKPVAETKPKT